MLLLTLSIVLRGCSQTSQPSASTYQRIQSENPDERMSGIIQAGREKDGQAVALLIDRLEDDDPAVRLCAIQALERITSQTLEYRYYASPADRAQAVYRWRGWWADHSPQKPTGPGQTAAAGGD